MKRTQITLGPSVQVLGYVAIACYVVVKITRSVLDKAAIKKYLGWAESYTKKIMNDFQKMVDAGF